MATTTRVNMLPLHFHLQQLFTYLVAVITRPLAFFFSRLNNPVPFRFSPLGLFSRPGFTHLWLSAGFSSARSHLPHGAAGSQLDGSAGLRTHSFYRLCFQFSVVFAFFLQPHNILTPSQRNIMDSSVILLVSDFVPFADSASALSVACSKSFMRRQKKFWTASRSFTIWSALCPNKFFTAPRVQFFKCICTIIVFVSGQWANKCLVKM